ncbi:MAG: hypothetical protein FWC41_13370, partial [Firmicutes bacterium]|nr:hypothetical protein [Bacillota bacterium]
MGFFASIKNILGYTKLSELSIIVDKKLKEGKINEWLEASNQKESLKKISDEILQELKKKQIEKYSTKQMENAIVERAKYWSSDFEKCKSLKELELCLFCSYLLRLIVKITKKVILTLKKISWNGIFLCYSKSDSNHKDWPLVVIVLHFSIKNKLIDEKQKKSLIELYIVLLAREDGPTNFSKKFTMLKSAFGNQIEEFLNSTHEKETKQKDFETALVGYHRAKNDPNADKTENNRRLVELREKMASLAKDVDPNRIYKDGETSLVHVVLV